MCFENHFGATKSGRKRDASVARQTMEYVWRVVRVDFPTEHSTIHTQTYPGAHAHIQILWNADYDFASVRCERRETNIIKVYAQNGSRQSTENYFSKIRVYCVREPRVCIYSWGSSDATIRFSVFSSRLHADGRREYWYLDWVNAVYSNPIYIPQSKDSWNRL